MTLLYCDYFFFFKLKTSYDVRISDWSSDVCSSDLRMAATSPPPRQRPIMAVRTARKPGKKTDTAFPPETIALLEAIERKVLRSEERSVGKESVSTCRSRWATAHENNKKIRDDRNTHSVIKHSQKKKISKYTK